MKIGILTNYNGPNYGAMLQAYSLWKTLEEKGHDVVFMKSIWNLHWYVPLWKCFYGWDLHGMRSKFRDHFRYPITEFSQGFPETDPLPDFRAHACMADSLDAVVVGSDQVWNPRWVLPWLDIQFLGFVPPHCRRIAYAASLAVDDWGNKKRDEVGRLLNRFDAISVREKNGERVIRSLADVDVQTVLDPVLLHEASFFRTLFEETPDESKKTVFTYFAGSTPVPNERICIETMLNLWPDARYFSDKIPIRPKFISKWAASCGINGAISVSDWLSGIACADFVLSDSFHGTAFSILFHRPFAVRLFSGVDKGMNQRIFSLLNLVGLQERTFTDSSVENLKRIVETKINWQNVDARLSAERESSLKFLDNALNTVKS